MKTLSGILFFVLIGAGLAAAQSAPAARLMTETSAMGEKIVKGSPFSADAVNESVQVLGDGNRIVRSSANKLYRNSEGRFRREISGGSGGAFSSLYSVGPGMTIIDPVQGHRYMIDMDQKTARIGTLAPLIAARGAVRTMPAAGAAVAIDRTAADKIRQELNAAGAAAPLNSETAAVLAQRSKEYAENLKAYGVAGTVAQGSFAYAPSAVKSRYETRTEELGTQSIEGVEAVGTRTTTTIPAGDIGNERPIEIVYEKWYSNELQLVIMSRHNDPRYGEQTYRLTNIVRSEPDPSLFTVPTGFKVISEAGGRYRISTPAGAGGQNVVWTKSSGSGNATTVRSKP